MTKRRLSLALSIAMWASMTAPAVLAQEAPQQSMPELADALGGGDTDLSEMIAIAALPEVPDSGVFAAMQGIPIVGINEPGAAFKLSDNAAAPARDHRHSVLKPSPGGCPMGFGKPGAGCPVGFGRTGAGGPFGTLRGDLALSDEQYEKLYSIKNASGDATAPKKTALREAMRDLMDNLGKENQDSAKIKSLQNQIASLKADLSSAETDKLVQMSQVLTADQRKSLRMAMIRASLSGWGRHHHRP